MKILFYANIVQKKFASVPNCIKHEKKCPKSLNLLVTENQFVQVNTEINSSSQRHKYLKNELSVDSEITKFIEKFQNHFTSPTLNSFSTHQLSSTTISTYVSNIKVFASWLLKSYNVDGENALQIIFTSDCLPQYVKYLDVSNYTKKTITNHLLAIQRFILYIKEQISLNSFQNIKSSTQNKKRIEDCCEWVSHQISYLKPIANADTKTRNSRLSMESRGKWITLSDILKCESKAEIEANDVLQKIKQLVEKKEKTPNNLLDSYRNFTLLSLITMIPTLRTQNYDLIVLSKPEIIAKTKKNAIIFLTEKNEVLLQYAKYKTINKYGVQYMTLPNKLAIICYNYYAIIRPLYFSTTITDDDLNPLPFFVTKNGKKIKKIGALFKNIMSKWANKPNVTIGDVRKSMATAIHSSSLDKTQKNHLHDSMLHDEDTANNYYVQQHPKEKKAMKQMSCGTKLEMNLKKVQNQVLKIY